MADARSAHHDMTARGVRASELLAWDSAPPMFSFTDPDGNRFYVVEAAPAG